MNKDCPPGVRTEGYGAIRHVQQVYRDDAEDARTTVTFKGAANWSAHFNMRDIYMFFYIERRLNEVL